MVALLSRENGVRCSLSGTTQQWRGKLGRQVLLLVTWGLGVVKQKAVAEGNGAATGVWRSTPSPGYRTSALPQCPRECTPPPPAPARLQPGAARRACPWRGTGR